MASLCLIFDKLTQINFTRIELPKDRPEYNANKARGVVYNKTGDLMYELNSESIWQFPNNERLFMDKLHAIVYSESSPNLVKYDLTSNDGWLNYNKQLGFLGKNARLIVANTDPKQAITIIGEDINLDLKQNYFYSDKNIKATQNKAIITGHGFSYDKNQQLLKINSDVSMTYQQ